MVFSRDNFSINIDQLIFIRFLLIIHAGSTEMLFIRKKTPYPMLKESWIQILVEAVIELNGRFLPSDLIGELQCHAGNKLHSLLTRQIDVDNSVNIVADIELLARPQIVGVLLFIVLTHNAPNRQVINVHLVPVMVLDRVSKQIKLALAQLNGAVVGFGVVLLEGHVDTAELELNTEEILAESLMVMVDRGLWAGAERQRKVWICLLTVVVRTHRVHPEHNLFVFLVPVLVLVGMHTCQGQAD